MIISKDLFVIPNDEPGKNTFFLYLPLQGSAAEVTSGIINQLQKLNGINISEEEIDKDLNLKLLKEKGIFVKEARTIDDKLDEPFEPTRVTLFPTSDCNLECVYCYNRAGEKPSDIKPEYMDAATDFIISNALKNNKDNIGISFHGGGEPLLARLWPMMTEYVERTRAKAKANGLKVKFNAGSNVVFNDEQREWVVNNMNHLSISLDGPEEIHDAQRPTRNGKGSFNQVMKSLEYFDKHDFSYGFRATITDHSVTKMEDIVRFVAELGKDNIHMEPLFECGRCVTTMEKAPNNRVFYENFLRAQEVGKELGVEIYYSGGTIGRNNNRFCGALGSNFCVTPDGDITSCYEVSRKEDPRSETFFFGTVANGSVEIFDDKLRNLKSRTVENLDGCKDCFNAYNCAGDCPAKITTTTGDMFTVKGNNRCYINKQYLLKQIKELARSGENE